MRGTPLVTRCTLHLVLNGQEKTQRRYEKIVISVCFCALDIQDILQFIIYIKHYQRVSVTIKNDSILYTCTTNSPLFLDNGKEFHRSKNEN